MKRRYLLTVVFAVTLAATVSAQTNYQSGDPLASIAADMTRVTTSVEKLSSQLKAFVDKWEKVGGMTLSEKQQKLVMGLELLVRTEQRVATLQKFQIDVVEKQNETRSKLTQNEIDLRPRNIERSFVFEGTTETVELREAKEKKLTAERQSLTILMNQLQINAAEVNENLRDARDLANRLRRMFLPQIERELYEQ